jgi:hypothetical protein
LGILDVCGSAERVGARELSVSFPLSTLLYCEMRSSACSLAQMQIAIYSCVLIPIEDRTFYRGMTRKGWALGWVYSRHGITAVYSQL